MENLNLDMKKLIISLGVIAILLASVTLQVKGNTTRENEEYLIYDSGQGTLIEKTMNIQLDEGTQWVSLKNLDNQIQSSSSIKNIELEPKDSKSDIEVLEIQSQMENGLKSKIGQEVEIELTNGRRTTGNLIDINNEYIVMEKKSESTYVKRANINRIEFTQNNDSPVKAKVSAPSDGEYGFDLRYKIDDITWEASYDLTIRDSGNYQMKLSDNFKGDIVIENPTNKYLKGEFKLVSGQVMGRRYIPIYEESRDASGIPAPRKVDRVYTYDLSEREIDTYSQKSVSYIDRSVDTEREYIYQTSRRRNSETVQEYLKFQNGDQPLPKGIVNIYENDEGSKVMIGQESIQRSPSNSMIELSMGSAYDLKGSTEILDRERNENNITRTMQITLKNHHKESKTVKAHYRLSDGQFVNSNIDPETINPEYVEWKIDIPAEGEELVKFTLIEKLRKPQEPTLTTTSERSND